MYLNYAFGFVSGMQDTEDSVGPLVAILDISEIPLECGVGYGNISFRGRAGSL